MVADIFSNIVTLLPVTSSCVLFFDIFILSSLLLLLSAAAEELNGMVWLYRVPRLCAKLTENKIWLLLATIFIDFFIFYF